MTFVIFLVSLILLVIGAELLVRGASQLAISLGLSALVIGLTVVAFGTSAPELAVSLYASLNGKTEIAIGNVIGSNIMNVLFILGLASLISPLVVSRQLIRFDVPVMIGASVVAYSMALSGNFSRVEGLFLFAGLIAYTITLIRLGKTGNRVDTAVQPLTLAVDGPAMARPLVRKTKLINCGLVLLGLVILVFGSNLLVSSASLIARSWGISEAVIGATIVAGGTSLPELATSVMAAIKGQRDLAVGNIVGSNVFNLLCVLGLSAATSPIGLDVLPAVVHFDFPVMVVTALVCLPIFFTGGEITRWEGAILLGCYFAYATFLLLSSTQNESLIAFKPGLLYFALPLLLLNVVVSVASPAETCRDQRL